MEIKLPDEFLRRMREQLGGEYDEFIAQYALPPVRGLRVNTLKVPALEFAERSGFELEPTGILDEGFVLRSPREGVGAHPYHIAGAFYMQEPSAMSAVAALDIAPGMRVLDLCAAPGGKSGAIAARLNGEGLLVANEYVASRAKTLMFNMERLGVANSVITNAHPDELCGALEGYFDAVLVDAPCSGEGMFRKDETAIAEWSPEHVAACAQRQRGIIKSASRAVAPEGSLVYSTCTFSRAENEEVIEDFLACSPQFELCKMQRLYPHTCKGEGHFVAKLRRRGGQAYAGGSMGLAPCRAREFLDYIDDRGITRLGSPVSVGERIYLLPQTELPEGLKRVKLLRAGVAAGELRKGRFVADHALYMASGIDIPNGVELKDDARLGRFLAGETIEVDTQLSGDVAVKYDDLAIGYGKAVDGILKNHLPKGLRQ